MAILCAINWAERLVAPEKKRTGGFFDAKSLVWRRIGWPQNKQSSKIENQEIPKKIHWIKKFLPAIKVPVLIPAKRSVFPKAIPKKIKENINNVVDWADWLESVEDAEIRKKSTPAVEKLKKRNRRIVGEKN